MKTIAMIPIDNRPVCYDLLKAIAAVDEDLKLLLPEKKLLGNLKKNANSKKIIEWFKKLPKVDAVIISLDTIAYGGLIPSRRSKDSLAKTQEFMNEFKKVLTEKAAKVYAFSSIMRISNNNVNEEEKPYWDKYGKKIFQYSFNFHKDGEEESDVPEKILSDYLATRRRNFEINQMYLDWMQEDIFETLVFSKDDCAEFGLNVLEAGALLQKINEKGLKALIKTGADEIPMSLLSRAICDFNKAPKISLKFLAPKSINLISNYEDISIEKSVKAQLELAGCQIVDSEPDIELIINNFEDYQGEIVMEKPTKNFDGTIELPQQPYMIADVRFANGADNKFVEKIFENEIDFKNFFGFSAWNTSANTLGSLICAGLVRFFAKKYSEENFKKLQTIRFLDDWAYQANARQEIKKISKRPNIKQLKEKMIQFEQYLAKIFKFNFKADYYFPWDRFFEVGINIDD